LTPDAVIEATISEALDRQRVDRVVAIAVDVSRAVARDLIEQGAVSLDGEEATQPSHRVAAGSSLRVQYQPRAEVLPQADPDVALTVLHEDPEVLVVDKAAGIVVHPGAGHAEGTLVNGLLARYPELAGVGDPARPGIVHRLDAGTTGLLAVARTQAAYERLVEMLAAHEVRRDYRVLCAGVIEPEAGVIDAPIGRSPRDPTAMAVVAGGRRARTEYRRLAVGQDVSLVACRLETGRTHQIRVHLRAHGFPVVGDRRYGGGDRWTDVGRPMLHAATLAFAHPVSGEMIRCETPIPEDMARLCSSLGIDV
jgi:23S rRNA pseudouridine1911/1915/1917 synthase